MPDQLDPLETLTAKLARWLMQQPEWPALFQYDRRTRRVASQAVAKVLFTIPTRVVDVEGTKRPA